MCHGALAGLFWAEDNWTGDIFMVKASFQRKNINEGNIIKSPVRDRIAAGKEKIIDPLKSKNEGLGNQIIQQMLQTRIVQAKFAIGSNGDEDEREADKIADQVMDASQDTATNCSKNGKHECHKKNNIRKIPEEDDKIQTKGFSATNTTSPIFSISNWLPLSSKGDPLPPALRKSFENQFGYDLSRTRIHADSQSNELARKLSARAFTNSWDIVFGEGQYEPSSYDGKWLLAHELSHVIQQSNRPSSGIFIQRQPANEGEKSNKANKAEEKPSKTKKLPSPGPDVVDHNGVQLSENGEYLSVVLENMIITKNLTEEIDFVKEFVGLQYPPDVDHDRMDRIKKALKIEHGKIISEQKRYCSEFEQTAYDSVVPDLLDQSEKQIKTERIRYGLSDVPENDANPDPNYKYTGESTEKKLMNTASMQGLTTAAAQLAKKQNEIKELETEARNEPMLGGQEGSGSVPGSGIHERLDKAMLEYKELNMAMKVRYPILASMSGMDDISRLQELSAGPSPEAATIVANITQEKLDNIREVREENNKGNNGKVHIWTDRRIVQLTKSRKGIEIGSLEDKFISYESTIKASEGTWEQLLAVLAIALSLISLAILKFPALGTPALGTTTGELSGAIFSYISLKDIEQWEFERAASGTNLDMAESLCREAPSLLWLGMDILFALSGIKDGVRLLSEGKRIFNSLSYKVMETLASKDASMLEKNLKELNEIREASEVPGIADKVRERATQGESFLEKAEREVITAESEAVKAAEKDGILAEFPSHTTNSTIKFTKNGPIICCDCRFFREAFAPELANSPGSRAKLQALENILKDAFFEKEMKNLARAKELEVTARELEETLESELDALRRERIIPSTNPELGYWDGPPGNSNYFSKDPEVNMITHGEGINYSKNQVNFDKWSALDVPLGSVTGGEADFIAANEAAAAIAAKNYPKIGPQQVKFVNPDGSPNPRGVAKWMEKNDYVWHHRGTTMQCVPRRLNQVLTHMDSGALGRRRIRYNQQ